MYVIGTAGHVDHGKSTLVRALTGIDPDRLREEKERGMTIDLGFAWLKLPSNREVSLVDVPGHERFIKNMLAGVGGIDLAMLVIAADEGPMPQTEEHLSILELLRVKRAVVALTKRDLVDGEWLELVTDAVQERLARSPLRGAPIVAVSAMSGEGLSALLATLDDALDETPTREDLGRPRLPIDRVFTMSGFGTIVTGTLIGGRLQVGQELEVQPGGLRTRARGIQMHRQRVEEALPGSRVAVNLGGVAVEDLRRGQVVTTPGWLQPTQALDVHLEVLRSAPAPLVHNAWVTFHTGADETTARVALLEDDELQPGDAGWAQLKLDDSVALARGDLFVLRTPNETIGGGEVVDPHARRHRRRQPAIIRALELRQSGTPEEVVLQTVGARRYAEAADVARQTGLPLEQVRDAVAELVGRGSLLQAGDHVISLDAWRQLGEQTTAILEAYHRQSPLRSGMAKEELRNRLGLPPRLFALILDRLAAEGIVAPAEATVARPGHTICFTPEQEALVRSALAALTRERFAPPSLPELGLDPDVVSALAEQGKLVRVSEAIAFHPDAYEEMIERIRKHVQTTGSVSVAEVRDMFDTSRRYALALLEHLDDRRITRRVGDVRVLR